MMILRVLLLALLALFAPLAPAAITFSSSGSNTGSTSASVGSLTVTSGQLITVVVPLLYTSAQTPAAGDLTKDAGSGTIGTPTLDKYIVFNSGNAPYYTGVAFYSVLVTGSGSLALRVTPTGTSAVTAMHVSIWNGTWDASRVESAPTIASSATDNQTSWASASATSAGAALFLSGLSVLQTNNNAITKDAAYTLLTSYQDGAGGQAVGGAAYHLVSSGTTESSTWTGTGSTNYGWSSGVVVYKEAGASPATLSSPTPSGTIGTSTTATLGATTDQASGTFYWVASTTNNVATATATQIKAGQNSTGAAAAFSGNAAVSTTSPSAGATGLTAATLYYYAEVQNNTNGDSNVVSGSFTTAAAASTAVPVFTHHYGQQTVR